MLQKIDFIIKTFERYNCLNDLLASIENFYPEANIIIADDSASIDYPFYKKWKSKLKINLIVLPFNSGLSFGRNMLLEHTSSPYILLLDDDFVFTEQTKIEHFLDVLENSDAMICGGCTIYNKAEEHYEFDIEYGGMEIVKNEINNTPIEIAGHNVYKTDSVLNFFLAKAELFEKIKWDNDLKLSEHLSFFLDFKLAGLLCYYLPTVKIIHTKKRNKNYGYFRQKGKEYQVIAFHKNGIKRIVDKIHGNVHELDGNVIKISLL